jgi:hypothetical protein
VIYPKLEALDEGRAVFVGVEEAVKVGADEGLPVRSLFWSGGFYVHGFDLFEDVGEPFVVIHTPLLGHDGAGVVGYVLPDRHGEVGRAPGGIFVEVVGSVKTGDIVVELTDFRPKPVSLKFPEAQGNLVYHFLLHSDM